MGSVVATNPLQPRCCPNCQQQRILFRVICTHTQLHLMRFPVIFFYTNATRPLYFLCSKKSTGNECQKVKVAFFCTEEILVLDVLSFYRPGFPKHLPPMNYDN